MGIVVFFSEGTSTVVQLSGMMVYKVLFAIIFLLLGSTWSKCWHRCGECPPDGYTDAEGGKALNGKRPFTFTKYLCKCCSPGAPATCSTILSPRYVHNGHTRFKDGRVFAALTSK